MTLSALKGFATRAHVTNSTRERVLVVAPSRAGTEPRDIPIRSRSMVLVCPPEGTPVKYNGPRCVGDGKFE